MGLFDQLQNVLTQYAGGNTAGPQNPQDVDPLQPGGSGRTTIVYGGRIGGSFPFQPDAGIRRHGEQPVQPVQRRAEGWTVEPAYELHASGRGAVDAGLGRSRRSAGQPPTEWECECYSRTGPAGVAGSGAAVGGNRQQHDPSIVDTASQFYAQHSTLVKTLGGMAMTLALAHIAEKQGEK